MLCVCEIKTQDSWILKHLFTSEFKQQQQQKVIFLVLYLLQLFYIHIQLLVAKLYCCGSGGGSVLNFFYYESNSRGSVVVDDVILASIIKCNDRSHQLNLMISSFFTFLLIRFVCYCCFCIEMKLNHRIQRQRTRMEQFFR